MPAGWGAKLKGHAYDLEDWAEVFASPFEPWVERVHRETGEAFILRTRDLDGLADADQVREMALPLISQLNGAMTIARSSESVEFEAAARFNPDGTVNFTFSVALHARGRARVSAIGVALGRDGLPIPPPASEKSDAQRWFEAAQNSGDLSDLLAHIGRADNWYDLYKAIELLSRISGTWHRLKKTPEALAVDLDNIKRTANFYRHAREVRPEREATLGHARAAVARVALSVLG